ncbi:UPF0183 protein, partial [Mucuna pruriens]
MQTLRGHSHGHYRSRLYPSIRIEPFSLEMLICEANAQIRQQPNIYDVLHVNFSNKMVGVRSLMDKPFVLPLPVGKIYMEEVQFEASKCGNSLVDGHSREINCSSCNKLKAYQAST